MSATQSTYNYKVVRQFAVMTVIFPFAGSRGSFFHAGAAFQPYWWIAAPIGLDAVLAWATVGEIANRLRGVFGEHRETLVL